MHDSAAPAALVRDGDNLVLVLRAGLLPDDVVEYLDRLLDAGLSPLLVDGLSEDDDDLAGCCELCGMVVSDDDLRPCDGLGCEVVHQSGS